jgi:lysophospholipase L1-like esterase
MPQPPSSTATLLKGGAGEERDQPSLTPASPKRPSHAQLRAKIPKKHIVDIKTFIEDPKGTMKPFYEALARTAQGVPGSLTRISHWGDSSVAPDQITALVRNAMQRQFGDGGHGFILTAPPTKWYYHAGVRRRQDGWKNLRITHRASRDGRYGLGGVRAVGQRGAFATFATRKKSSVGNKTSRFQVYYQKGPRLGRLSLRVDGQPVKTISTRADKASDAVFTLNTSDDVHKFRIWGRSGRVNVYGVVLEREGPGVVYDNLGLTGCFGQRLLNFDAEHLKTQLAFRKTDLMVSMFGGNYLGHPYWRPKHYRRTYEKVIRHWRSARPEAACLVISPLDHGEVHEGKKRTKPRVMEMVQIQRETALANNCAFFSLFDAMGGEGTMVRWRKTRPRLAVYDMAHVSSDGARILAKLIYGALLKGFADYLEPAK